MCFSSSLRFLSALLFSSLCFLSASLLICATFSLSSVILPKFGFLHSSSSCMRSLTMASSSFWSVARSPTLSGTLRCASSIAVGRCSSSVSAFLSAAFAISSASLRGLPLRILSIELDTVSSSLVSPIIFSSISLLFFHAIVRNELGSRMIRKTSGSPVSS